MPLLLHCHIWPSEGQWVWWGPWGPGVAAGHLLAGALDASAAQLGPGSPAHVCPVGVQGCPMGAVHSLQHVAGPGDSAFCCSRGQTAV